MNISTSERYRQHSQVVLAAAGKYGLSMCLCCSGEFNCT